MFAYWCPKSALDGLDAPRTDAPSREMSPTAGDLWCCKAHGPIQTIGAAMLDARRTRKATLDRHYGCDVRCASRPIGPQRCPRIAIKGWSPTVPDPLESFDDLKMFPPFFTKKKHVMSCFPAKICMQHKHTCEIRISNNMPNKMQKSTVRQIKCSVSDRMSKYTSDRKSKYIPNKMLIKKSNWRNATKKNRMSAIM
jgi:hypothetical protein